MSASIREHAIRFPQLDREISTHGNETVFQCARRSGVRIVGACGGRGSCGTCTVLVVAGEVHHTDAKQHASRGSRTSRNKRWVRACQIVPRSDCTIEIAARSLAPVVRSEVGSGSAEVLALEPLVMSKDLRLPPATLADNLSDVDRVVREFASAETIDLAAARQLSGLLREHNWSLRVHVRERELIGFAPARSPTLGLAIDLGTTNAAGFLVDLQSGVRLASVGIENPQVAWGADVITRINYASHGAAHAEELRAAAVSAINALAHDLCHAINARTTDIVDVAVCGNTAMHHLLLGLSVRQLGRAPFVAAVRDAMDVKARDLGVTLAPGAVLHMAPNVGGFVGSDHVSALLATQNAWSAADTSLVMDIGTNTEISLIHRGDILSASCPSGPALEGGHISCGMRVAEGAIERVWLADGAINLKVIGDEEPIGVCGSGVIDALATLRRAQILDQRGRLASNHPAVRQVDGQRVAVLAPGVHFSQHDVRSVQLAKSAIRTGIELLLCDAGLRADAIESFIIAGAFGAYLDVTSGIEIGLLPGLPLDRFQQVGNAAGLGVQQMLASRTTRTRARELARRCRYIELSTHAEFQKSFLRHIGFNSQPATRRASC